MWWPYVDFFLINFLVALAWCLAVLIAVAIAATGLHLVLRPLLGGRR